MLVHDVRGAARKPLTRTELRLTAGAAKLNGRTLFMTAAAAGATLAKLGDRFYPARRVLFGVEWMWLVLVTATGRAAGWCGSDVGVPAGVRNLPASEDEHASLGP